MMKLAEYVAKTKREIWEDLREGRDPRLGEFNSQLLADARVKGQPQIGDSVFTPESISFEFIYSDGSGKTIIFPVLVPAPKRIVFLPVPGWVIESIWQGDVDGSYHFEKDATVLVEAFQSELTADKNRAWFGRRQATRRE